MYLYGKGVEKDYKKAFDYFRKAAELRSAIQDCAEDSWKCL